LDAATVKLFVMKHGKEFELPLASLSEESQQKVKDWYEASIPKSADWVQPRVHHSLEFAELGNYNHEAVPLSCSVYIPTGYEARQRGASTGLVTGGQKG